MFGSLKKRVFALSHNELPFVDENLVDIGGELNVSTLLKAYRAGSFPWTVHPVTWWSPDPRAIIEFDEFHISRSFRKFLGKNSFTITFDKAFRDVIENCAESRPERRTTWITPEFIEAYSGMHRSGHAHSLEIWQGTSLVGGIYGVSIGGYFAGESMFHRLPNASKVALYSLTRHLKAQGYAFLDIQMPTKITLQLGARVIPRKEFLDRMREAQMRPVSFVPEEVSQHQHA